MSAVIYEQGKVAIMHCRMGLGLGALLMIFLLAAANGMTQTPQTVPSGPWKITFVSNRDASYQINVMNSDGSNVKELRGGSEPALSPDGRRMVFVSGESGPRESWGHQIYVMNADGSNVKRLTSLQGEEAYSPTFSPDGHKIVFCSRLKSGGAGCDQIYVMNADGSHAKRLRGGHSPKFSPDGRRIVFASTRSDGIYVMNADGSNVKRLTGLGSTTFSPDGRKSAYASGDIYVTNSDGSNEQRLTDSRSLFSSGDPMFSPDSSKIVFAALQMFQQGVAVGPQLYVMNVDGSNLRRLTSPPLAVSPASGNHTFSPDGRKIAFVASRKALHVDPDPNDLQIYVMNADGSHVTRLTGPPGTACCPIFGGNASQFAKAIEDVAQGRASTEQP